MKVILTLFGFATLSIINSSNDCMAASLNYSLINAVCIALLNNDLDAASRLLELDKEELFGGANQVNLVAGMFSDNELAEWLYLKCVEYQSDSWEAHYDLGYYYKEKVK